MTFGQPGAVLAGCSHQSSKLWLKKDKTCTKMDVDDNPETAKNFGIMSIPTLLIKKDGQVVDRLTGYTPKEKLNEILDQYAD